MPDQLSVRVDEELAAMIEEEIEESPYEPKKSDIVRTALREYLSGNVSRAQPVRAD